MVRRFKLQVILGFGWLLGSSAVNFRTSGILKNIIDAQGAAAACPVQTAPGLLGLFQGNSQYSNGLSISVTD